MMERSALTACPTKAISAIPPGAKLIKAVRNVMSCQRLNTKLRPAQHNSRQTEVNKDQRMNLDNSLDEEKFIMKLK